MNLYLHIGTEKTGSTFLQTYLARNRKTLEKHKIHYPHAGIHEDAMQKGLTTPGNAQDLEKYIKASDWAKVKTWLLNRKNETIAKNCDTIVLSNEIFFLGFAQQGVLSKLIEVLKNLDISCQGFLLVIREPVSQALSLYKHRTKSGKFIPIDEWLNTNYFIAEGLKDFYSELAKTNIKLSQFMYKKDSEYLVNTCMNTWLGLNEDISIEEQSINPSLTLSELVLLCEIYKTDKILAKTYYNHMVRLDSKYKSDDIYYKNYVKSHINNHMVKYNELWDVVNNHMIIGESKFHYTPCDISSKDNISSFSTDQIKMISKFLAYANSNSYKKQKAIESAKQWVRKITPKSVFKIRKRLLFGN